MLKIGARAKMARNLVHEIKTTDGNVSYLFRKLTNVGILYLKYISLVLTQNKFILIICNVLLQSIFKETSIAECAF